MEKKHKHQDRVFVFGALKEWDSYTISKSSAQNLCGGDKIVSLLSLSSDVVLVDVLLSAAWTHIPLEAIAEKSTGR